MQITDRIHAIRLPFTIPVRPGLTLERFVYAYLIAGKRLCLIDCGVAASAPAILDAVRSLGRTPGDVAMAVITHAHPDHIGGAAAIREATGCIVAAHVDDAPWIQDVERQNAERPVPGFHALVGGAVKIDRLLWDGESIDVPGVPALRVIHTPGHSRGHIALFDEAEGALFSGDSIPVPGGLPIYDDVLASIQSLKTLAEVTGLRVLLSSWDEPRVNAAAYARIDEGFAYIQRVHDLVREETQAQPAATAMETAVRVVKRLGLPEAAVNPLVARTIEAHRRVMVYRDLKTGAAAPPPRM